MKIVVRRRIPECSSNVRKCGIVVIMRIPWRFVAF